LQASQKDVARLLVGALGCVGFWLNGLGPVLPLLQHDLHTSRGVVAVYPSMFAVGLVGIGLVAPNFDGPRRRHGAFVIALVAMMGGAAILSAVVTQSLSLVGALAMGVGAAVIVALVPALGADARGAAATGLLSRANALSSAAGLLAPLLLAATIAVGAGWQTGYLVAPALVVLALLLALRRRTLPDSRAESQPDGRAPAETSTSTGHPAAAPHQSARLWVSLLLSVSVEFCMVFWAATYLRDNLGLRSATATALAGAFLAGMALGRGSVTAVTRVTKTVEATIQLAVAVALGGFTIFWVARIPWLATLGLTGTGLGIALLYPLTVTRYVRTAAVASTRASARAALASGLAIGVAPFLLALISGAVGLHLAYLLVPCLFVVLVLITGRTTHPLVVG
jgi:cyanate permease